MKTIGQIMSLTEERKERIYPVNSAWLSSSEMQGHAPDGCWTTWVSAKRDEWRLWGKDGGGRHGWVSKGDGASEVGEMGCIVDDLGLGVCKGR